MSSANKDESGYDPMKMLKQKGIKKVDTDEDIEALVQENSKEDDNKIAVDNTGSNKHKQTYHSSDESDSDEVANYTVPMKKKKRDTQHSDTNKKSVSESARDVLEQDREENKNQSKRQTILLSATLTQAVEKLAGLTMRNPIFVDAAKENLEMSGGDISEINEDLVVPQGVTQSYIVTPPKLRMVTLSAYIAGRCQVRNTLVSSYS